MSWRTPWWAVLAWLACLSLWTARIGPVRTGDAAEYLVMAMQLADGHSPALLPVELLRYQSELPELGRGFEDVAITFPDLEGRHGRQAFPHSWVYPLTTVPALWLTRLAGWHPGWAFWMTNLAFLTVAAVFAARTLNPAWFVLLLGGPVVWWINKPHPEVWLFSLLIGAALNIGTRPAVSTLLLAVAGAQNPAFLPLAMLAWIQVARGKEHRRALVPLTALCLAVVMAPAMFYWWHLGRLTPLSGTTIGSWPDVSRWTSVVVDPAIGLLPNVPWLAMATLPAFATAVRAPAQFSTALAACGASFACLFVAAALPLNLNHGGTPGMSRYALWLMATVAPLAAAHSRVATRQSVALLLATALGIGGTWLWFRPDLPENYRYQTAASEWVWTKHPSWHNPSAEIFAERASHREPAILPSATDSCEKVLTFEGRWPLRCLPVATPSECLAAGTYCYANRRDGDYEFTRTPVPPGWNPVVNDANWDASEPAHRRLATLLPRDAHLLNDRSPMVRAVEGAAGGVSWESAGGLFVYLSAVQPGARVQLRVPHPMRVRLIDLERGETVATAQRLRGDETLETIALPVKNHLLMEAISDSALSPEPSVILQRHHLHRGVWHRTEERVERGTTPQQFPSRARRLTEDDVRDAFTLSERDQSVRRPVGVHPDHRGAETFGQPDILLQGFGIATSNTTRLFTRRLNVDGVPFRSKSPGNTRTGPDHAWGQRIGTHAHHDPLGNERGLEPFPYPVARGLLSDLVGNRP